MELLSRTGVWILPLFVPQNQEDFTMVVQTVQMKQDEQHPLLKIDTGGPGGGDVGGLQRPPSTILTPAWNVACVPKRSCFDRWPEFISTCWKTLVLLGITFIVFCALGMSAYRRQSLIIVKCNTSKPESNVYYHHIVPRGSYLPFSLYSNYLSSMAIQYPLLRFNVFFLIDDSHDPVNGFKHSKIFNVSPASMHEKDKHDLKMCLQRYGNVNITIMTISQYMSMTPFKCKWKMIPLYYLPFYARIFTVWEHGGIGLDLISLSNQFNDNEKPDQKITTILRQHNDGIEEKKYIQTLNTISHQDQSEFFNLFYNLMTNIFAKSDVFFDNLQFESPITWKTHNVVTISRNYRNKRENAEVITNNTSKNNSNENTNIISTKESDLYAMITNSTLYKPKLIKNDSLNKIDGQDFTNENNFSKTETKLNITNIQRDNSHVILFYDFAVFPDNIIGPSYSVQEESHKAKIFKTSKIFPLSITYDGTFVAVTSRHHPFLGRVLSSIFSRISPRLAIENALSFQCSGVLRNDEYCNNIYILN